MQLIDKCLFITPSTKLQAGFKPDEGGFLRLFFGDQTDETSFESVSQNLGLDMDTYYSTSYEVQISGHFKPRRGGQALDTGALFVEEITFEPSTE